MRLKRHLKWIKGKQRLQDAIQRQLGRINLFWRIRLPECRELEAAQILRNLDRLKRLRARAW